MAFRSGDPSIRMFCGDKINFQHAPARTTLHLSSARQLGGLHGQSESSETRAQEQVPR
jgi:hypothetical protein